MLMAGENDNDKKGFSGLSDLASKISGIDDAVSSEDITERKPSHGAQGQKGAPRNEPKRKPTTSPPPIETVSSNKSGGGSSWKWILSIVGVIVVIWIANNEGQDTKKPSSNIPTPTHTAYESRPSKSALAREIENGKVQAKQMEAQIKDMDDRIEDYERRMRSYRASGMTHEYNMLIPSFNSLIDRRNDRYKEYSRLIDGVNAKVKQFNAGYR